MFIEYARAIQKEREREANQFRNVRQAQRQHRSK